MSAATTVVDWSILADMNDITRRYQAALARIARYPVTDVEARARLLDEVEEIYRANFRRPRRANSVLGRYNQLRKWFR